MRVITVYEAKNNFAKYMAKLNSGEEDVIIVTKNGVPMMKWSNVDDKKPKRIFGLGSHLLKDKTYDLDSGDDVILTAAKGDF